MEDQFDFTTPPAGGWLGCYREALSENGSPRAHWLELIACMERLGVRELAGREENSRRLVREQGVTTRVPGESGGSDRPWQLDILPLPIASWEWKTLEAGLTQRVRLLNRILIDLYGCQQALRSGWVPAPLVYANPNFLRGCHGALMPGGNCIAFYAADLARSPDGQWWVLNDHTQVPSGIAFALQNRSILSSVLPEAVRAVQPRFIGEMLPFMREALLNLAQRRGENPAAVVLTPGPHHEAYFEHTYLARMLGFTLAEPGDLTVRDKRVFIKTLGGLRAVDVMLRHVNDCDCDPLEVRTDLPTGVPGLLEAVRAAQVSLGNTLGCGFAETPALMAFLPNLCRGFLDEELLLPSVPTWWCDGGEMTDHVCADLDRLVVRPAFPPCGPPEEPDGGDSPRATLEARIRAHPHRFVGQREILLSHAPALANGRLAPAPFVLRLFAICCGDSCRVMPGGLVRVVRQAKLSSADLPLAGASKDLWVLPDSAPAAGHALQALAAPPPFVEGARLDLSSRTAEDLFWVGRYTERLENLSRIVRCAIGSLTGEFGSSASQRVAAIAGMLKRHGLEQTVPHSGDPREAVSRELLALIFKPGLPNGLKELVSRIGLATSTMRDRLSADAWRVLMRLEHDSLPANGSLSLLAASSVLDTLLLDMAAFNGMEMESMTRGHGWMLLDFGRRLERSFNLVDLLQSAFDSDSPMHLLFEPLLEICESTLTYRRKYFAELRLAAVLQLLLLEESNPRSLAFQLAAMKRTAADLPQEPNPDGVAAMRRGICRLAEGLQSIETGNEEWTEVVQGGLPWLFGISEGLMEISDLLTQVYFSHTAPNLTLL